MIKSGILFSIFTALIFCGFCGSVAALTPGDSDYKPAQSVILSDILGESVELVSPDTQAIVTFDKSVLPAGTAAVSFNARVVGKADSIFAKAGELVENITEGEIELFDFSIADIDKNMNITKLNGKLSITVACKNGINSVFYFDDESQKIEDMQGVLSENSRYITFETDHFSYYILAKAASTAKAEDSPKPSEAEKKPVISAPEPEKEPTASSTEPVEKPEIPTAENEENPPPSSRQTRDVGPYICLAVVMLSCEFLFSIKRALCK